jgi:probable phosphoglycerate mutase
MSDIVVIRPGCTDFDEQHRIQGALDLPLNERGVEQVAELVEQLRPLPLEAIYTGDCEPARSTAEAIGRELGLEVKEIEGLRNLNQGLWQGLPVEEIRRKYPKVYRQWHDEPGRICPPEGEAVPDAVERIRKALHRPMKKRGMIGVVASEPLATLICCVIRGCPLEMPNPPADPARTAAPAVLTPGVDAVRLSDGSTPAVSKPEGAKLSEATSDGAGSNGAASHGVAGNGSPVVASLSLPVTPGKPS